MSSGQRGTSTKAIHGEHEQVKYDGAHVTPVFRSTLFQQEWGADYGDIKYPRLTTLVNQTELCKKVASLEGGQDALVTASGMAAIATTILTVLANGGHMLAQKCLYGGTHSFFTHDLNNYGMSLDFMDTDPKSWKAQLKPNTKAIYVESITNPILDVIDHGEVVKFAKENGLVSIIDNTFATPINFQPLQLGYDLSIHSATKYLNGHSDLVAGAIVGSADTIKEIKHNLNHLGGTLDPEAAYMLDRGMKTLAIRVRQQNESAMELANFLQDRPEVASVNYPGLEMNENFSLARKFFEGFGGMLSFELKEGGEATKAFADRTKLFLNTASLGGVESLVTIPAYTSHCGLSKENLKSVGVSESLVRISVGIEDWADLKEDLRQALEG